MFETMNPLNHVFTELLRKEVLYFTRETGCLLSRYRISMFPFKVNFPKWFGKFPMNHFN